MSYFVCGFDAGHQVVTSAEGLLAGLLPTSRGVESLRVDCGGTCLTSLGNAKAIPDVAVVDERLGSWVALIGTPLVRFETAEDGRRFLEDFVANPGDCMRQKVDGNLAVIGFDGVKKQLIVATDYNTTVPVYFGTCGDGVILSSHELVLARVLSPEVDVLGFCQTIYLGIPWGDRTRFQGIQRVPPCTVCRLGPRGLMLERETYWHPASEKRWSESLQENVERWKGLLGSVVWKYYECAGKRGVLSDFTAGEDARLLVAQCHALRIPYEAQVTGLPSQQDVVVARRASEVAGFGLRVRRKRAISGEELKTNATRIVVENEGYLEFFKACSDYATDVAEPLDDVTTVKFCGVPGGEAFRGSYYPRGKALRPGRMVRLDLRFFVRLKYLLDYSPGFMSYPDSEFLERAFLTAEERASEVRGLPIGTQIDHLLRVFQTSAEGMRYKNPLYLPLATAGLTRSIYGLPPEHKQWGRLTRACTEELFPQLAFVRTQDGVPTIKWTLIRSSLFLPEYTAVVRRALNGAVSRLLKWRDSNKWYFSSAWSKPVFARLLTSPPYSDWFRKPESMATGEHYDGARLSELLSKGREGSCEYVSLLGRVISQEMAVRWVRSAL